MADDETTEPPAPKTHDVVVGITNPQKVDNARAVGATVTVDSPGSILTIGPAPEVVTEAAKGLAGDLAANAPLAGAAARGEAGSVGNYTLPADVGHYTLGDGSTSPPQPPPDETTPAAHESAAFLPGTGAEPLRTVIADATMSASTTLDVTSPGPIGPAEPPRSPYEAGMRPHGPVGGEPNEQPPVLRAEGEGKLSADANLVRATLSITPTFYSPKPGGGIVVYGHVTILDNRASREFLNKMDELLTVLHRSNEIAGETRDKLIAEMNAGLAIYKSPKPDPKMIDLLLKRPLMFIAERAAGVAVGAAATAALVALGKATGLW